MMELKRDKVRQYWLKSRLLATQFIDNPNNYPQVDHIDGNPQNNQLDNLRWSNQTQNLANKTSWVNGKQDGLNLKGIYQTKTGTYIASIQFEGKQYHIGTYTDLNEAIDDRNAYAILLYGEYAKLNQNV